MRGYAFAGGERHVARVDVSIDGGAHWVQAELLDDLGRWAWRHWRTVLDLAPGEHEVLVRAWDSSAATQPEDEAALWNPKGYVNNARPRIRVVARDCPGDSPARTRHGRGLRAPARRRRRGVERRERVEPHVAARRGPGRDGAAVGDRRRAQHAAAGWTRRACSGATAKLRSRQPSR